MAPPQTFLLTATLSFDVANASSNLTGAAIAEAARTQVEALLPGSSSWEVIVTLTEEYDLQVTLPAALAGDDAAIAAFLSNVTTNAIAGLGGGTGTAEWEVARRRLHEHRRLGGVAGTVHVSRSYDPNEVADGATPAEPDALLPPASGATMQSSTQTALDVSVAAVGEATAAAEALGAVQADVLKTAVAADLQVDEGLLSVDAVSAAFPPSLPPPPPLAPLPSPPPPSPPPSPSVPPSPPSEPVAQDDDGSGGDSGTLPTIAIVGIVCGACAGIPLLAAIMYGCCRHRWARNHEFEVHPHNLSPQGKGRRTDATADDGAAVRAHPDAMGAPVAFRSDTRQPFQTEL